MGKVQGILLYFDDWDAIQDLSSAERGELVTALMDYAKTGEAPTLDNTALRISFRLLSAKIDRDTERYAKKCKQNQENRTGKTGGRSSTTVNDGQRPLTVGKKSPETVTVTETVNETVNETVVVAETVTERAHARNDNDDGGRTDEPSQELVTISEQHNEVFDAAQRAGFPMTAADMDKAVTFMADYSPEWVLEAVRRASGGTREQRCWRYVGGILRRWKAAGGMDEAQRPQPAQTARSGTLKPVKLVNAQQYTQREYTSEELDSLFDNLADEELSAGTRREGEPE